MPYFLKRIGRGETFDISPDKEKVVLGRSPDCDISFGSVHISRQHCQIIQSSPHCALHIKNIRATNCTYVNEQKLQDPDVAAELQVGYYIGLGVPVNVANGNNFFNNNYVILQLHKRDSPHLEKNGEAGMDENRNTENRVPSQTGEPPYNVTIEDSHTKAPCVQNSDRVFGTASISNQEQRVPIKGLKPHIPLIDELKSGISSPESTCFTSHVEPCVSMQGGMPWKSNSAITSNASDFQRKHQNFAASEGFTAEDSIEELSSSHEPKHIPSCGSISDTSLGRKVTQNDKSSETKSLHDELTSPSVSVDKSEADPNSLTGKCSEGSSKSKHLELIIVDSSDSSDGEIASSPDKLSEEKGGTLPGKRKRLSCDELPSSASSTADVSIKKKVKGFPLVQDSEDIVTNGETLSGESNLSSNKISSDGLPPNNDNETSKQHPHNHDVNEALSNSDSDSSLFLINNGQQNSKRVSPSISLDKCLRESQTPFSTHVAKTVSRVLSQRASSDSDSDSSPVLIKRRPKNKFDQINSISDDSNDSDPVIPTRKFGVSRCLKSSSDEDSEFGDSDQGTSKMKRTVTDSLMNVSGRECVVVLKKLPSTYMDVIGCKSGKSSTMDTETANSNTKEKCKEDRIRTDTYSQKYHHRHKRKRLNDKLISFCKGKEETRKENNTVEEKRMQNEDLDEHTSTESTSKKQEKGTHSPPPNECISAVPSAAFVSINSEQSNKVSESNDVLNDFENDNEKLAAKESCTDVEMPLEIKVKVEKDVFEYSQLGEEIWLSSDEEEGAPAPLSNPSITIDEELGYLSSEDEQKPAGMESIGSLEKQSSEDSGNKIYNLDDSIEEDQWFPVLSQSFLVDSDEYDDKEKKSKQDAEGTSTITAEPESLPGPSGLCNTVPDGEEPNSDEWWPILSQGFFDDDLPELGGKGDEEDGNIEEADISNNNEINTEAEHESSKSDSARDLQSVIKKLEKKPPRTSQLTEAVIPPRRERKAQRKNTQDIEVSSFYKKSEPSSLPRENIGLTKTKQNLDSSKKIGKSKKNFRKNKVPDLRTTLSHKFNLDSIKSTMKCRSKDKHHLVTKKGSEKTPASRHHPGTSSNKPLIPAKTSENMSIQKSSKPMDRTSQEKVHSKVVAKVTKKNRFEKLLDYDISNACRRDLPSKRGKYTIPKSSAGKSTTVQSEVQGGESVLDKRKQPNVPSDSDDQLPQNAAKFEPESRLENVESKSLSSSQKKRSSITSDKSDKIIPCDTVRHKPAGSSENAHNRNQSLSSTTNDMIEKISKDMDKLKSNPKRVNFPKKVEELVKYRIIPSRTERERTGPPNVRAREILPQELKHEGQQVPHFYMEIFIHSVCRWNYDWLECYNAAQENYRSGKSKSIPSPPPVVSSTNYQSLILYSSYNDYKETHSSLFYLELWERIYRDWINNKHKTLQGLIEFVKPAFVKTHLYEYKLWAVKLMVAIPQTCNINFQDFRQGTLISLKVKKASKRSTVFGYIDSISSPHRLGHAHMNQSFSLVVRVAKDIIQSLNTKETVSVSSVSYIRPCSRVWESLCKLPLFPLCKDILSPSLAAFSFEREAKCLVNHLSLNDEQVKVVTTVSSKCMSDSHVPKLSLIHGPPGTGKTNTVVALIAQMAMMGRSLDERNIPNCRILICAPSNAAVDEVTLRLIQLRDVGLNLRVVRVGVKISDNPLLRNCTLDNFVQRQIKIETSTPRCESAKQEWQRRKILLEHLANDVEKARQEGRHNEVRDLEARLIEVARANTEFEKSFTGEPSARERYELQQKWQREFLLKAEVVATTLNSCVSGVMGEVLNKHQYHFTCCIVDEAGQCQETETLLPLLLGIRKLVLVGDHQQLPATVLSQLALSRNLKQSLFERLHHRLVLELQRDDVIHTLSVQYRMHPEIVKWPSLHFYRNKLTTPESAVPAITNLKPYLIFNLQSSQEKKDHNEIYNPAEASLIYSLLEVMQPHLSQKSVGIVTPYQRQRIYLQEKLARFKGIMNLSINTVDGFQGQERDVIILSFVRANNTANIGFLSHRQRLNVALTRAKNVCYIVASLSSLEGNKEWHSLIKDGKMRGLVYSLKSKEENDKNFLKSLIEDNST